MSENLKFPFIIFLVIGCMIAATAVSHVINENDIDTHDDNLDENADDYQSNNQASNFSADIDFEEIDGYYLQIGWQLNQSIPDHDVALYLPNEDIFNNTFDSYSHFQPDFSNYSYVFVFWEQKYSSGYEVNITKLHYDNGTLSVFVDEDSPKDGEAVFWWSPRPIDIVKIPKSQLENMIISQTIYLPSAP